MLLSKLSGLYLLLTSTLVYELKSDKFTALLWKGFSAAFSRKGASDIQLAFPIMVSFQTKLLICVKV